MSLTRGDGYGREARTQRMLGGAIAALLVSVLILACTTQILASPVVIDGDSSGSWEDLFTDTTGVETWDNLDFTEEGVRIDDIFWDDFTGLDGDLPDEKKWDIIDGGHIIQISSHVLVTEIGSPGLPTWGTEMVQTKEAFGGKHTLTWRQAILTVPSGAYYQWFILNGSDNKALLGINQNYADEYWLLNYVTQTSVRLGTAVTGWHDYMLTFDNGYVEFYFDGVNKDQYDFGASSLRYRFGVMEQNCYAKVATDDILITSNITSGNLTSTEITLPTGQTWESLVLDKTEDGIQNRLNVSILDGTTLLPISGFEHLPGTDIDISAIDHLAHPSIRLTAHFSGDGNSTPILRSWKVTWIDTMPPSAPTGLVASNTWTGYSLLLSWTSSPEPDVRTYLLYYSTNNVTFYWIGNVPSDSHSFTHYGLTAGTRYYYRITAADEIPNESPPSLVASGVPDTDMDNDGIGDSVDPDRDGDTVPNAEDDFPDNPKEWRDSDGDGIGDNAETGAFWDTDADDDGFSDILEEQAGSDPEDASSVPSDTDGDGIVDIYDQDDDNDGHFDVNDDYPYDSSRWLRPNEMTLYAPIALVLLVILMVLVVVLIILTARSGKKEIGVPQEETPPPPSEE